MRRPFRSLFFLQGGALALALLLVGPIPCLADASPLDETAVLCSYHALSGRALDSLDIEAFCWRIGRPTFSAFKPAEMFSGNTLREVRRDLNHRIRRTGPDTLFRWTLEAVAVPGNGERVAVRLPGDRHDLPQATPSIQAEISSADWRRLKRTLSRLSPAGLLGGERGEDIRIGVLLRPRRVQDRLESRNIARMDVVIPIRSVVFQPVAVVAESRAGKTSIPVEP